MLVAWQYSDEQGARRPGRGVRSEYFAGWECGDVYTLGFDAW
jgi:hypothetical protein